MCCKEHLLYIIAVSIYYFCSFFFNIFNFTEAIVFDEHILNKEIENEIIFNIKKIRTTLYIIYGYIIARIFIFLFDYLTPFWNHLANNIHYWFIKDKSIFTAYGLVKEKACYFYYDKNSKQIINKQKYFNVPFLFTNNYSLTTNIFTFVTGIMNIIYFIIKIHYFLKRYYSFYKCSQNENENDLYCIIVMILLSIFIWHKIILLLDLLFLHLLGENNYFHQIRLFYINGFKSLSFNNDYYVPKNNRLQAFLTSLLPSFLVKDTVIISIPMIAFLFFVWFIDYCLRLLIGFDNNYAFYFVSKYIIEDPNANKKIKTTIAQLYLDQEKMSLKEKLKKIIDKYKKKISHDKKTFIKKQPLIK